MATTKNTQKKTNNTTKKKTNSAGKGNGSKGKSRSSSDDTLKFLLVLVIAGIAIALIFISQGEGKNANGVLDGTPTPTMTAGSQATQTPAPDGGTHQENINPTITGTVEATLAPTQAATPTKPVTATPLPTNTPVPTVAPTATTAPTSTPTPTPALSAKAAKEIVEKQVDTSLYNIQLVNENLLIGNNRYYQFGAILDQEFISPFLVVDTATGTLYSYDSTAQTVFDFAGLPKKAEPTKAPTPTPVPPKDLTAEEAYRVLCTYSKEALHTAKEVKEYDAEYGAELTLIDGKNCYRINLSEVINGKVRNRGEFYVSVDGSRCYYIDSNTNEFVQAVKK